MIGVSAKLGQEPAYDKSLEYRFDRLGAAHFIMPMGTNIPVQAVEVGHLVEHIALNNNQGAVTGCGLLYDADVDLLYRHGFIHAKIERRVFPRSSRGMSTH